MNKNIIKINFHLHSTGSDGKMSPEEVVKEAISAGIKYICFTDHYLVPETLSSLEYYKGFFSEPYKKEVRRLQAENKKRIDISFGAEFDWFEGHESWIKAESAKDEYDYLIGSVHFVPVNGQMYHLNFGRNGKEQFIDTVNKFKGIKNLIKEYYRQTRLMIKARLFDSVGHLDTIKMYNSKGDLFSETEDWYQDEVRQTLDALVESDMALEINIRGLFAATEVQYPSLWILKEARKRNIPITMGTDSHRAGEVGQALDQAYNLAREAGYKEIVRFKARKMIPISI